MFASRWLVTPYKYNCKKFVGLYLKRYRPDLDGQQAEITLLVFLSVLGMY